MNLHIYDTTAELTEKLAHYIIKIANEAIVAKDRFDFVLTGGNSPKALYQALSTTYKDQIDWSKVYFFFGDERTVLPNHKDYNGLMAKENLFDNLQTPASHIFYVDTTLAPAEAAQAYKKALDEHFGGQEIVFDLILLGMGDDAHTASIFPHTDLVKNTAKTVAAVFVEKLDTYRVSFTAPLINQAKNVAFLTFGEGKANALSHVLGKGEKNYDLYPSQLIAPVNGHLDWFTDKAATSML
ncbi:6-phosphogluconolactonase [Pedobacter sp. KR3-3]|uniref:6-phosphogluconolactonase n=1 Tax=Pedobacter albus TaxID=3113905 RepID=A0ABU7I3J8_9SPHI|nr:6-phosphogluconolactonase [Pedobacter sp. KR3-3]MEE1944042.1 6-phosphogluconolactonase [Pedobacter sp. KR3-3]